jgi:hypothetical protein
VIEAGHFGALSRQYMIRSNMVKGRVLNLEVEMGSGDIQVRRLYTFDIS